MQAKITKYGDSMQKTEGEDAFQETEFGLIPKDWKVVRLGEIAEFVNGFAFKPTQWKDKGLPIIRIQNLTGNVDKYNYFDGEIDGRYLVHHGDLLISWSASLGVFLWKGGNAWLNQHIFKVTDLSSGVSKMFFYYVLQHYLSLITRKIRGTTMKHIVKKEFVATSVPLPPLSGQAKIAQVLGTIQRAIEQQDKIIQAAKNLKKSLMQKLFTEGLGHTEFKETEIGPIPISWEVVKLVDLVDFSRKPRDLNLNSFERIPFITMEMISIKKTNIDKYLLKEPDRIASGVYCEKGDILLPKITPCFENGKQGIIENIPLDFAFATTEVYPIKPKNNQLDKMFLFYFLAKPDVRRTIAGKMQGTTGRRRVPKDVVKNTLIPLPQIPEQREIARILSTVDKKIEAEERKKATLNELFKTMLHKLMTAEIRLKDIEV
mgnify:CR=1 FL=1